jgi:threonine/homoserine/homoserine lactone efflux protein
MVLLLAVALPALSIDVGRFAMREGLATWKRVAAIALSLVALAGAVYIIWLLWEVAHSFDFSRGCGHEGCDD